MTLKCKICGKTAKVGKHYECESICPECFFKPFKITSVCRADLTENYSEDKIAKLDDGDMQRLAEKLANAYCDNSFWIDLPIITDYILEDKGGVKNAKI